MELKHEYGDDYRQFTKVLIEPLWNWNTIIDW